MSVFENKLLLDVGGTFIKCSDGREIPIDSNGSREVIVASFKEAVGKAASLSIAIPGPFDYSNGTFLMKHKFATVYGESFCDLVNLPSGAARFEHDVIAMLRGEMACGNGRGYKRVALVTLGTGLGFALSIDGEILRNATGSPLVPIYNRPYKDGILEDYVSKRGIMRGFEMAGKSLDKDHAISVKELATRAFGEDKVAIERFSEAGTILGKTISPILQEYGIDCLLLGGQISRSWKLLAPAIRSGFEKVNLKITVSPISDFDNATFNGLRIL